MVYNAMDAVLDPEDRLSSAILTLQSIAVTGELGLHGSTRCLLVSFWKTRELFGGKKVFIPQH